MTKTPQRAYVRSLPSIARSICWANSTSAGCLDSAADGGGLAEGGVGKVLDSFRDTRSARPIRKGTSEHVASTISDPRSVVFRLDISIGSTREQRCCSACTQQLARCGIHLFDINRRDALTEYQALGRVGAEKKAGPGRDYAHHPPQPPPPPHTHAPPVTSHHNRHTS